MISGYEERQKSRLLTVWCATALYATLVGAAIYHHEPWADEAQAWLLARDSNLFELWTKLLHYEGSPPLWHTLLHTLARLGVPYGGMNITSGILGLAGAWLLLRYAPLPLPIRLLLPFTFFLCYQYAVVARNYSLLPVLLFGCAALYKDGLHRLAPLAALLCMLAGTSVQGLLLSVSIWLAFHTSLFARRTSLGPADRRKLLFAGFTYVAALILLTLSAWPAKNATFIGSPDFSFQGFYELTIFAFHQAFGPGVLPLAVLGLSIPFLWRGEGLIMFISSSAMLCSFGAIVYSTLWHHGLLFLAWLFAMWISASNIKLTREAIGALLLVIVVQCYWTFASINYDWKHSYSGSLEAARYLRQVNLPQHSLYALGFACVAIQPYFSRNIFANLNEGAPAAFWDWSSRNHTNDTSERLGSLRPDYVIVGYMTAAEEALWNGLVATSGYQAIKRFDGNLFWQASLSQPESFILYKRRVQRGIQTRDQTLSSVVKAADPVAAKQLLYGFYAVESDGWRWTARKFTAVLQRPTQAEMHGARLHLQLFIPDTQIRKLGRMTLHADVAGYRLKSAKFTQSGSYNYERDVPATAFSSEIVPVRFSFDKAVSPSRADARELGAVVTLLSLQAK